MYILLVAKGRARAPETAGRRRNRVRRNMVCHLEKQEILSSLPVVNGAVTQRIRKYYHQDPFLIQFKLLR